MRARQGSGAKVIKLALSGSESAKIYQLMRLASIV
jgi:hypothetical protein